MLIFQSSPCYGLARLTEPAVTMRELIKRVSAVLGARRRMQAIGLLFMMTVGAGLEALGIGLIMPFIALFSDPESFRDYELLELAYSWMGLETPRELLFVSAATLLGIYVIKNAYLTLLYWVQYQYLYSTYVELSKGLLERYLFSPYLFHTQRNSSDLIRNVRQETATVVTTILMQLFSLAIEGMVIVVLMALVFVVEPLYAPVVIVGFGSLGALFYWFVRKRVARYGETRQEQLGRMIQWIQQGIGGIKEAKVLGVEPFFVDAYRSASQDYADASRRYRLAQASPRFFIETVGIGGMLALVLLLMATGREMTAILPVLALFGMVAVRIMPSLTRIIGALTAVRHYRPALNVVFEDYSGLPSDRPDDHDVQSGSESRFRDAVRFHDITFRYPEAGADTIEALSFEIARGETVAFVGPSGAGKTTAVDLMLGLLEPVRGGIIVDDKPLSKPTVRAWWQRKVGYISQPTYILDDTVRNNVAYGVSRDEIDDGRVWEVLRAAQLGELVEGLSGQLDSTLGESGARLSGGQRQRIGIARALFHDPEVIILDEATSALDNETEREINRAIAELAEEKTIIIIAHRLSTVRHCDRLYFLQDGRLVDAAPYEELLARSPAFRRMVNAAGLAEADDAEDPVPGAA